MNKLLNNYPGNLLYLSREENALE